MYSILGSRSLPLHPKRPISIKAECVATLAHSSHDPSGEQRRILSSSTIIQYPAGTGLWYMLRCEDHNLDFGALPLVEAVLHLGQHSPLSQSCANAITHFGIEILHCTEELAHLHNSNVLKAHQREPVVALASSNSPQVSQPPQSVESGSSSKRKRRKTRKSRANESEADLAREPAWPEDFPATLTSRLRAHGSLRRQEIPANGSDSMGLFVCPLCIGDAKKFAQFRYFIRHLRTYHM